MPGKHHKQHGGKAVFPAEYFGGNSGRYFDAGSTELQTPVGVNAVSQGTMGADSMGPNLTVYNGSDAPTGIQTGGDYSDNNDNFDMPDRRSVRDIEEERKYGPTIGGGKKKRSRKTQKKSKKSRKSKSRK